MTTAKVLCFPSGKVAVVELRERAVVRWWPNETEAWMATTFDDLLDAQNVALRKTQEGARKVAIEPVRELVVREPHV